MSPQLGDMAPQLGEEEEDLCLLQNPLQRSASHHPKEKSKSENNHIEEGGSSVLLNLHSNKMSLLNLLSKENMSKCVLLFSVVHDGISVAGFDGATAAGIHTVEAQGSVCLSGIQTPPHGVFNAFYNVKDPSVSQVSKSVLHVIRKQ